MSPTASVPSNPAHTVGDLGAAFLEQCGVRAAFGVICSHNMPMLDALHRRGKIRFVPARSEVGALVQGRGVHALGGGIGQGLAMGIGAAVACLQYPDKTPIVPVTRTQAAIKTIVLAGDGGYGVIKNIQDADYGSRHCCVDLDTSNFAQLCASMGVKHLHLQRSAQTASLLQEALAHTTAVVLEVDMPAWGPFAVKFAGPPRKL